jgi:DNA-binding transcriptional LysR family regulator
LSALSTTEAGRNFYERAKRAIAEADEAELAARGAAATRQAMRRTQQQPRAEAVLELRDRLGNCGLADA